MPRILLLCGLLLSGIAHAGKLTLTIDGVDGELHTAALNSTELSQYTTRDVSAAQVRRLYDHAAEQITKSLEPYGYYHAKVSGDLRETAQGWSALLHVAPGEPVTVETLTIDLGDAPRQEKTVADALKAFAPKTGQRLDHAAYERSKLALQTTLLEHGYLDAKLDTHVVAVTRDSNRAAITLQWNIGPHYRIGLTQFSGDQLDEGFLDRYLPWKTGDDYRTGKLLTLQQRLVDADYFSIVEVQPDLEHENPDDGTVPILVKLAPAKRTIYTSGVFIDTDTGAGIRGGIERRWVNSKGHKLKFQLEIAQRLKTLASLYTIPLPGTDNRSFNFGAKYRDENTDTSKSRTASLVANETREWHGFTRTIGVHALAGNFTVADQQGTTTLLYPEVSLTRKKTDNIDFTRNGYSFTVTARAGGGATTFEQVVADAKYIHALGDSNRLILRGSLGATQVADFDKLPPELRFFAGGDRSIRGYAYQTIGPLDTSGKVIGGKQLAVFSTEFEHYFTPTWGIATFIDTGNAFSGNSLAPSTPLGAPPIDGGSKLKIGTGLGLRWRSPVGMVRVDLGTPINDPLHGGVQLHLTIGPDL